MTQKSNRLTITYYTQRNIILLLKVMIRENYIVTWRNIYAQVKRKSRGASLVAQWLRICLLMQGTRVRVLVWEDPTCRGATGPVSHNYWACVSGACAPQQERPRQWEARAPRWRVAPACCNWRKPSHRNEDPTQSKINKLINFKKKREKAGYKNICVLCL